MDDKQSEDELLGLNTSGDSSHTRPDKTENVDDIEAEILLLSSLDNNSKSAVDDLDKTDKEEICESPKNLGNNDTVKPKTDSSSIESDANIESKSSKFSSEADKSDNEVQDDDLLLGSDGHGSQVEILDEIEENLLEDVGYKKKSANLDNKELDSSLILVEDDDKNEAKLEKEISSKKSEENSQIALEIIEDDDNTKSDSFMEMIDDDNVPHSSFRKRKSNNDNCPSGVEIIDAEDYDDDELEIIGSESDVDSEMMSEDSNSFCEGKICIFWSNGSLFVWNADDAQMLREECRIVGKLTGCLPRAPRQNNHLGLPLQLMPEEAKLLVDIDAAVVVEEDIVSAKAWKARERGFKSVREDNVQLQIQMFKESRKEEVKQKMGDIIAGKKAKRQKKQKISDQKTDKMDNTEVTDVEMITSDVEQEEKTDKDPKTSAELNSTSENDKTTPNDDGNISELEDSLTVEDVIKHDSETSPKHTLVQIFTENPWKRGFVPASGFQFPVSERDLLRYSVFKDLWKKGYFLTSGAKFGGDFLVYPGDPARYHSHYIAVCLGHQREVPALDVVSMGRLASNVRKSTLLCSLSQRRKKVLYTSLQWTGIS